MLNGAALSHFSTRIFLTNTRILPHAGRRDPGQRTLSPRLGRWIDGGIHEDLDVTNHGVSPVRFNLELLSAPTSPTCSKSSPAGSCAGAASRPTGPAPTPRLRTVYLNEDFRRSVSSSRARGHPRGLRERPPELRRDSGAGERWHGCLLYEFQDMARTSSPRRGRDARAEDSRAAQSLRAWREESLMAAQLQRGVLSAISPGGGRSSALRLPI